MNDRLYSLEAFHLLRSKFWNSSLQTVTTGNLKIDVVSYTSLLAELETKMLSVSSSQYFTIPQIRKLPVSLGIARFKVAVAVAKGCFKNNLFKDVDNALRYGLILFQTLICKKNTLDLDREERRAKQNS